MIQIIYFILFILNCYIHILINFNTDKFSFDIYYFRCIATVSSWMQYYVCCNLKKLYDNISEKSRSNKWSMQWHDVDCKWLCLSSIIDAIIVNLPKACNIIVYVPRINLILPEYTEFPFQFPHIFTCTINSLLVWSLQCLLINKSTRANNWSWVSIYLLNLCFLTLQQLYIALSIAGNQQQYICLH